MILGRRPSGDEPEPLRAVIYDLDGLLIDSEPCWEQAEMEVLRAVGVPLTPERCHETTGLRLDEAVAYWAARHPWTAVSHEEVVRRILERVLTLLAQRAPLKRGVRESLAVVHRAGLRAALASSSPLQLIEGALERVGLRSEFEQVVSAEGERFGKPHPGVYLTTAGRLGVAATSCVALEDSVNGVLAATSAGMRCIAIPERWPVTDPRFSRADAVIHSLLEIDEDLLRRCQTPSMGAR
ncbi:MAG TPA: hexitol phosphatase HxpB [Myxococcaceae bacterium]|nr:hexitol phosphatase HxpB [Myxococcaceae bacterium]